MYPVHTPDQLATYLKSLRKKRGLTQGALGMKLGVTGARIAAIERAPGSVGAAQLLEILHLLGGRVYLEDRNPSGERVRSARESAGEW